MVTPQPPSLAAARTATRILFRLILLSVMLIALPRAAFAQQSGSLLIWPVNPVIEGDAKAAALWLENPGKAPATLQVRIFAWAQQDGRNTYAPQNDVIGSPPIFTIEPGQRQLVRLTRLTPPPGVPQQAFRVIVDEVPTGDGNALPGAAVSFRMRYSLPLFALAARRKGQDSLADPAPQLSWRLGSDPDGRFVEVHNKGDGHARLTNVSLSQGTKMQSFATGLLGYVLPGAWMRWPLPPDVDAGGELVASVNGGEPARIERRRE
ncbi:MAG: molecular chaperone [Sphingopyxis sp.]|uniref:fimbrial biogenesis chaperone n=1 Tax=Sphingopyxis sp. TaxID=1908224 RepID=UPI002ABACFFE|nr:molecular chaperone [Sphingopyxis sp.]MDZ3831314.1 molecular chaperone [Sphingopyxis sp.]